MEQFEKIQELYKQIRLAVEFDTEVTIGGNGCNAFECINCIKEVLDILEIPEPKITEQDRAEFIEANELDY